MPRIRDIRALAFRSTPATLARTITLAAVDTPYRILEPNPKRREFFAQVLGPGSVAFSKYLFYQRSQGLLIAASGTLRDTDWLGSWYAMATVAGATVVVWETT